MTFNHPLLQSNFTFFIMDNYAAGVYNLKIEFKQLIFL